MAVVAARVVVVHVHLLVSKEALVLILAQVHIRRLNHDNNCSPVVSNEVPQRLAREVHSVLVGEDDEPVVEARELVEHPIPLVLRQIAIVRRADIRIDRVRQVDDDELFMPGREAVNTIHNIAQPLPTVAHPEVIQRPAIVPRPQLSGADDRPNIQIPRAIQQLPIDIARLAQQPRRQHAIRVLRQRRHARVARAGQAELVQRPVSQLTQVLLHPRDGAMVGREAALAARQDEVHAPVVHPAEVELGAARVAGRGEAVEGDADGGGVVGDEELEGAVGSCAFEFVDAADLGVAAGGEEALLEVEEDFGGLALFLVRGRSWKSNDESHLARSCGG